MIVDIKKLYGKDDLKLTHCYSVMAVNYYNSKNYEKAIEY